MRHEAWEYSETIHSERYFTVKGYIGDNYVDFIVGQKGTVFTRFTADVAEFRGYVDPKKAWWKPWTWFRQTIPEALNYAIAKCKKENKEYMNQRKDTRMKKRGTKLILCEALEERE